MAAQNSQGIQTLLEAEKEASKIVQKARQYRVDRLKAARSEAEKEIQALKTQKVAEFEKFEKDHLGTSDTSMAKANSETETQIQAIREAYNKNKAAVLEKLMNAVVNVKPTVHENAKVGHAA
ncbi:H+-ATPase G subunit-domain-containing protein [Paraphysoderma sedebokerense]|nr:H+-ATPase G subunit-domain-containing protein [Paraphysoderma sedebokerense]